MSQEIVLAVGLFGMILRLISDGPRRTHVRGLGRGAALRGIAHQTALGSQPQIDFSCVDSGEGTV